MSLSSCAYVCRCIESLSQRNFHIISKGREVLVVGIFKTHYFRKLVDIYGSGDEPLH